MRPYLALGALGAVLTGVAWWVGGRPGALAGAVALGAQAAAVALLRPAMRAPTPRFMTRWLAGMAVRALALAGLMGASIAWREALPPLPASLGFLGVLLPLLFLETRFLR